MSVTGICRYIAIARLMTNSARYNGVKVLKSKNRNKKEPVNNTKKRKVNNSYEKTMNSWRRPSCFRFRSGLSGDSEKLNPKIQEKYENKGK